MLTVCEENTSVHQILREVGRQILISKDTPELKNCSGIYKITNLISTRIYIGSAKDLNSRRGSHFRALKNGNHANIHLQRAYNKYGKDLFFFEVLEFCTLEELTDLEQFYIDSYKANRGYLYNICPVTKGTLGIKHSEATKKKISRAGKGKHSHLRGEGNPNFGKHMSEETKKKIQESRKWYRPSEETKKKTSISSKKAMQSPEIRRQISEKLKGRIVSVETRLKISKATKGRKLSQKQIDRLVALHKGKPLTEEHKKKISQAQQGFRHTKESIEKMSLSKVGEKNPMWGKSHTEEHKQKVSKSLKQFYANKKNIIKKREILC